MAILLGAKLEGYKPLRVNLSLNAGEIPEARAVIELSGVTFVVYAKPYMDVDGVDNAADYVSEIAEDSQGETIGILAAVEYDYYAEKYAKSLGFEVVKFTP
jgi:RecB family endonuclease NucS